MIGGGGERQQNAAFAEAFIEADGLGTGDDDPRRRATEQSLDLTIAAGARHEDAIADTGTRTASRLADAADGFISGHERVSEPRERRHAPGPQEPLGARADSTPLDVNHDVLLTGIRQRKSAEHEALRLFEHDSEGVHPKKLAIWRLGCPRDAGHCPLL
jgi:hypothetical protein